MWGLLAGNQIPHSCRGEQGLVAGPQAGPRRLAHLGCCKLPSPFSSCRQPPHPRQDPVIPVRPEASAEVGTEVGMLDWHRKATFQRPPAASLPTPDSWQAREGGLLGAPGQAGYLSAGLGVTCAPCTQGLGLWSDLLTPTGFCLGAVS